MDKLNSLAKVGIVLIVLGLVVGLRGLGKETSVSSGYRERVVNLSLLDQKRTTLSVAGILIVVGAIFTAVGYGKGSSNTQAKRAGSSTLRTCPFCAEEIQQAAKICKHCQRDLPASEFGEYQEITELPDTSSREKHPLEKIVDLFEPKVIKSAAFLDAIYHGQNGLLSAFWKFGGFLLVVWIVALISTFGFESEYSMFLSMIALSLSFVWVQGVFRSASRYTGPKIWPILAPVTTTLLVPVLLFLFYLIFNEASNASRHRNFCSIVSTPYDSKEFRNYLAEECGT